MDSEVEEEDENCIFKIMEALYPFFLANHLYPIEFSRIAIEDEIVLQDLSFVSKTIKSDGFSPSPYLYVREKVEFTDCAALALKLFILVFSHISETDLKRKKEWAELLEDIPIIVDKAISFIRKCGYSDKKGLRWAATEVWKIQKKSYLNMYFTSEVSSALSFLIKHYTGSVAKFDKEEIIELIRKSCMWILGQHKNKIFFGDEAMAKGEINYSFYALNCLFDCYEFLEKDQQYTTAILFEEFIDRIRVGEEELPFITYIDVPLTGYPKPIYYDDRSSIANIITTLCKGREELKRHKTFDDILFNTLNLYRRSLMDLKDPNNDLWNKNNFLLYLNNRAIEALLYFASFGQVLVFEKLSEQNLLEALKSTLENPQIQQIFLSELNRLLNLRSASDYKKEGEET